MPFGQWRVHAEDVVDVVNEAVVGRPAAPLRSAIAAYHGYRQAGVGPAIHRGLPSPFMTVIFTLDEPLEISAHVDPSQTPGAYESLVGGMHSSPAMIRHEGAQSGIQLLLRPLAARALLGLPAGELLRTDLHGWEVFGPAAGQIHEQLRDAATWPQRFAVLDVALTKRLAEVAAPRPEIVYAWRRLNQTAGTVAIAELAAETGWSARHLNNRFRQEIGLTPKESARVIRFDRARRRLGSFADLATAAAECGYFDQSHLAREFTALAGCSPTQLLAE